MQYNIIARLRLQHRDDLIDELLSLCDGWSAAVTPLAAGVELTVTIEAARLPLAVSLLLGRLAHYRIDRIEALPTREYDARHQIGEAVSVEQAAALLGVSPQAVRARIRRGTLTAQQIGRAYVVPREALAK